MKKQNDFYIGWQDEMPKRNQAFLKKILIPLFILVPILVLVVVLLQKPFNQHQFEFGNIKTISGTYYENPLPSIVADKGVLPDSLSHDIILVGYGKFGARGIMKAIEKEHGSLHGKKISLAGTLIYGDGKTLFELTEEEASLKSVIDKAATPSPFPSELKAINLQGEIIDPKCYFGVMKPGEGKVHKSCAIRCISGGIPPVFRHQTDDPKQPYQYYLLVDEQGREINEQVLPFVAEQITLSGKTNQFLSWNVLYVNVEDFKLVK